MIENKKKKFGIQTDAYVKDIIKFKRTLRERNYKTDAEFLREIMREVNNG